MPGFASVQWQGAAQLPSFYSPPTTSRQPAESDADVERANFFSPDEPATPSAEDDDAASTGSSAPSQPSPLPTPSLTQPPPPASLLSPAFTPPSTPGTATPSNAASSLLLPEPRGVPVDSSIPTGGCGSKHPRLLETLPHVECVVRARIPTTTGAEMFLHLYTNNVDNKEHLAIVFGPAIRSKSLDAVREGETEMDRLVRGAYTGRLYPGRTTSGLTGIGGATHAKAPEEEEEEAAEEQGEQTPPLVRIHSECYTGETVWSARCDCGEQLDEAARLMSLPSNKSGGIIIYLRQEGRGIGLGEKLKAYNLQDLGNDTVEANLLLRHPADARSYGLATAMLLDLGQKDIRLLTNNPDKIRAVEGPRREIVVRERVAMVPLSWKGSGGFRAPEAEGYLKTKIEKMGHMLDMGSPLQPRSR
ncbi:GTP cyclohydrolase II-domain-containing protein [Lasiosphaeria hispida]|uniref:GTP cyclohydrolase II n=1 Tax=Lasiosphaeria hispida TaxID=260671 RepID=A0AAJ0HP36_9PEZI|nr:GTP cyclohydrolase II-domain-containing protein [Lasiosphaeria hispida]